jgi:hypothetical protein
MNYVRCGRKTVSAAYRQLVLEEIPALDGADERYWRFLQFLTMGDQVETDAGERGVLAACGIISQVEGAERLLRQHRYRSSSLLEAWQANFTPISWTVYDPRQQKARVITDNGFSDRLAEATCAELSTPVHQLQDRCYLVSGQPYRAAKARQHRIEDSDAAKIATQERLDTAGCQQVQVLAAYLNSLPSARFTKLLQRLDDAYAVADAIKDEQRRQRAYRGLRAFADQPQQFYAPSVAGRSVRLFGHNAGLATLPREVRKALLRDHTSVDLKAAQLAIVATLWDVPSVKQFLEQDRSDGSIWQDLCEMLGLTYTADNKRGIKQLVYALCFGGGTKRKDDAIPKKVRESFPDVPDLAKRFVALPMIDDLLKARQKAAEKVTADQGGSDCFGNWIPLQEGYGKAASVLACQAQAVELRLLWPVVEAARTSDELDIVCWLFDGATLAFSDTSKKQRLLRRLRTEVQAVAGELGISTQLEVE